MKKEIDTAAWWWAQQIFTNVSHKQLIQFKDSLARVLENKFRGHWDEKAPLQGNAFRSLMVSPYTPVDEALQKAAEELGVTDLRSQLPFNQEIIMWVDPGEVMVKLGNDKRITLYKGSPTSRRETSTPSSPLSAPSFV
eukprot:TRINITY_DN1856_c0_g1_i2.p1 TRINITY_DN1856_c0_g1~~TRINITY_DN1856_c0_g1_i2.p1  ORF type:complete len:138 (+),score=23.04 TRINITY_DN1856_c0_g1_i2:76-489(+)